MASRPRRRIVFLVHAAGWGGTEVNLVGLLRALARRGHEVVVAQIEHDAYPSDPGQAWTVVHVPLSRPYAEVTVREWQRVVDGLRPETCVLVKTGHTAMRSLGLDLAVRRRAERYLVMENHPAHPIPRPRRGWRRLLPLPGPRRALEWSRAALHHRMAHSVVAVSDAVRRRLVADYAASSRRVVVLHAGVDLEAFRFDARRREEGRRTWGLAPEAFVFGTAARLAWVKRLDRLVEAFAAVSRESARPTRLLISGEGPDADRLRRLAQAAGVAEQVRFTGFIPSAVDALCALDAFVMTSEAEGLGMALLEAMACERPAIAVRCGGPAEILRDPALGFLVEEDVPAIAAAMRAALAAEPSDLAEMGRRARAHVVEHFDAAVQFERIADAVESA